MSAGSDGIFETQPRREGPDGPGEGLGSHVLAKPSIDETDAALLGIHQFLPALYL